jgi:hypothetical protein
VTSAAGGAPGASGAPEDDQARTELTARCNAIEEAYEFMLAYASQGLPNEQGSASGSQIRQFLNRCDGGLAGLPEMLSDYVRATRADQAAPYLSFIRVLARDAADAQAAIQMVLAQPSIGSQMIDNLNASIHLRALLTDLFLIDEILKP